MLKKRGDKHSHFLYNFLHDRVQLRHILAFWGVEERWQRKRRDEEVTNSSHQGKIIDCFLYVNQARFILGQEVRQLRLLYIHIYIFCVVF